MSAQRNRRREPRSVAAPVGKGAAWSPVARHAPTTGQRLRLIAISGVLVAWTAYLAYVAWTG